MSPVKRSPRGRGKTGSAARRLLCAASYQSRIQGMERLFQSPPEQLGPYDPVVRGEDAARLRALEDSLRVRALRDAESLACLGRIRTLLGETQAGRENLLAAVRRAPADAMAWAWLGQAHPEGRFHHLLRALEQSPTLAWARLWRCVYRLLSREAGHAEAVELDIAAAARLAGPSLIAALRGQCLLLKGQWAAAAEAFGTARRGAPGVPAFLYFRGLARRLGADPAGEIDLRAACALLPAGGPAAARAKALLAEPGPPARKAWVDFCRARLPAFGEPRAQEAIDETLEDDPGNLPLRRLRCGGRMLLRDFHRALEDIDVLLAAGSDATLHLWRGEALRLIGTHEEAIAELDLAIALDPSLARAHSLKAENQGGLGDYAGAVESLTRAIELEPEDGRPRAWRGAANVRLGRFAAGRRDLAEAARLAPDFPRSYLWLGDLAMRRGRPRAALPWLDLALALDPKEEWTLVKRFQAKRRLRDWRGALDDLNAAARLNSRYGWCYIEDALPLGGRLERLRKGLRELDAAVRKLPRFAWAWAWRGDAKLAAGRPSDALADLERALELDPSCAWAWTWKADALRELGRPQEAFACCERGLGLDPGFVRGRVSRGILLLNLGRPAEAVEDFDAGLAARLVEAAVWKSRALEAMGDIRGALGCLESFNSLGSYPPGLLQRGLLRARLGRREEGRRDIESVLRMDPNALAPKPGGGSLRLHSPNGVPEPSVGS